MENLNKPVILFDGVCNLCNSTVQFIIKRDPGKKFLFASLQSAAGQKLLNRFQLSQRTFTFNTFVYIEDGLCHNKSTAVLKVLRKLGGLWKLCYGFIIIPKPIRDFIYALIAHNRYRLFGKKEECMVPTPELKERFLEKG